MRAGLIYLVFLQHISSNVPAYASYLSVAVARASSLVISIKAPANRAGLLSPTPPCFPWNNCQAVIPGQGFHCLFCPASPSISHWDWKSESGKDRSSETVLVQRYIHDLCSKTVDGLRKFYWRELSFTSSSAWNSEATLLTKTEQCHSPLTAPGHTEFTLMWLFSPLRNLFLFHQYLFYIGRLQCLFSWGIGMQWCSKLHY